MSDLIVDYRQLAVPYQENGDEEYSLDPLTLKENRPDRKWEPFRERVNSIASSKPVSQYEIVTGAALSNGKPKENRMERVSQNTSTLQVPSSHPRVAEEKDDNWDDANEAKGESETFKKNEPWEISIIQSLVFSTINEGIKKSYRSIKGPQDPTQVMEDTSRRIAKLRETLDDPRAQHVVTAIIYLFVFFFFKKKKKKNQ
ncbi:hypothetical protein RFI_10527 [Reticulomyxa filosa]|uniref:Uncharacterized protein n=1 Tax=Reticulomyxa filosa TaxID=46433 RepID=X6NL15_RETFI|nr:hypothetical protein RFI_10527 [Reticulomyxa filosa]|eukprot:ETO26613.1 hypothetical protein RFI_10527 [Reticulomyxa filosa]